MLAFVIFVPLVLAQNLTKEPQQDPTLEPPKDHKNVPPEFHKFNPLLWLKPLAQKINDFITLANHPNFGGFSFFNPQHLWEKIHEKQPFSLVGPHAAVFGLANKKPGQDYPFPYRSIDNKNVKI